MNTVQQVKTSLTVIAAELEGVSDLLFMVGLEKVAKKIESLVERIRLQTNSMEPNNSIGSKT